MYEPVRRNNKEDDDDHDVSDGENGNGKNEVADHIITPNKNKNKTSHNNKT